MSARSDETRRRESLPQNPKERYILEREGGANGSGTDLVIPVGQDRQLWQAWSQNKILKRHRIVVHELQTPYPGFFLGRGNECRLVSAGQRRSPCP